MAFLNELAEVSGSSGEVSKGAFLVRVLRGISVTLCRGNAALFRPGMRRARTSALWMLFLALIIGCGGVRTQGGRVRARA
jgi:hypothetical protein